MAKRALPEQHTDPGLQPERTSLAWNRTSLALVISGILFLRWVPGHGVLPLVMTALTLIAAAGITASQTRRHRRSVRGIQAGQVSADVVAVASTVCTVVVTAALALFVVVALPLR